MYIEPNTDIKILMNCPLEPNYEHTIHFFNTERPAYTLSYLTPAQFKEKHYARP